MTLCGYTSTSIARAHYFTKTVVYHPALKTRVIYKIEHRLHIASATGSDRTKSYISTRPVWGLPLYYGGAARPPYDEVIPASWSGHELDAASSFQEESISQILRLITLAESDDARADRGTEVTVVSDAQMNFVELKAGEGGNGGQFAQAICVLAQACCALEWVLGKVDAGKERDWEAERVLRAVVERYATGSVE